MSQGVGVVNLFTRMKETFIIRTEWFDSISELTFEERAIIFDNLFHFHLGNDNLINLNNLSVKLVWKLIEPNLKRNISAYDKRSITSSENGKLGGRPKVITTDNQESNNLNNLIQEPKTTKEPNESLSVSDSVSVSDSDNESVIDLKKDAIASGQEKKIVLKSLIPDNFPFKSPYAIKAMEDYITHRRQLKVKTYTAIGLQKAMEEWEKWGEANFIEAVNNSIKNNYQGIFLPTQNPSSNGQQHKSATVKRFTGGVDPPPQGTPFGQL